VQRAHDVNSAATGHFEICDHDLDLASPGRRDALRCVKGAGDLVAFAFEDVPEVFGQTGFVFD
jgi:hypothetical protein